MSIAELVLAREAAVATDLGNGVAVPHARCPRFGAPLVVFGRSEDGVIFSTASPQVVHFVFLLVTPQERPEMQLSLLAKIARLVGDPAVRDRLRRARSPAEVLETLAKPSLRAG